MVMGTRRRQQRLMKRAILLLIAAVICFILFYQIDWLQATNSSNEPHFSKIDYTPESTVSKRREKLPERRKKISERLSIVQEITHIRGIDALQNYCNSPMKETVGQEGTSSKGFKLKMVHIFIRHGDRTSIHNFPGYKPETYDCKFSRWYTGNDVKFKAFPSRMDQMMSSARRKENYYFQGWPTYPKFDACMDAVLTSRGALQHLKLGQHIYKSYSKHHHLFEQPLSSQIYTISTGTKRTFQSAVAFLYGFVPSFNMSDVSINHSKDLHFCSTKHVKDCNCPHTRDLYIRALWFQSAMGKNSSYFKDLRNFVSELFKIDKNDLKWLSGIADALVPTFCHNFTIPCSTFDPTKCVDHKLLGKIWDAITDKEFSNWDDPSFNFLKYCSIKMTPVLIEVFHRIKELIENKNTPKFILYSGHDVTLSPLLYVLGLHDGRWPPYASRVVMELYENENDITDEKYSLKFLYNGLDKTEEVVFCKNKTLNGLCKLKLFRDFITNEILNRFGYRDYGDACFG